MNLNELIEHIFSRLLHSESIIINHTDIEMWQPAYFKILNENGLLIQTEIPKILDCDGCEQNCLMPIEIRQGNGSTPNQAFIVCDKRDDIGKVIIEPNRLKQWKISHESLALFLANMLELSHSLVSQKDNEHWHLGTLKGHKHQRPLILHIDEEINLSIAGHTTPILECLMITNENISVNQDKLKRLVDNPQGTEETPEQRKIRLLERKQKLIKNGVKNFLQILSKEEGVSKSAIKKVLYRKPSSESKTNPKKY